MNPPSNRGLCRLDVTNLRQSQVRRESHDLQVFWALARLGCGPLRTATNRHVADICLHFVCTSGSAAGIVGGQVGVEAIGRAVGAGRLRQELHIALGGLERAMPHVFHELAQRVAGDEFGAPRVSYDEGAEASSSTRDREERWDPKAT